MQIFSGVTRSGGVASNYQIQYMLGPIPTSKLCARTRRVLLIKPTLVDKGPAQRKAATGDRVVRLEDNQDGWTG